MTKAAADGRRWSFFRAGGFDQVKFETGADILALDELDQKLWVALSCPTDGLELDAETLKLLDSDHDGRIRASELIAAGKWLGARLKNADLLLEPSDAVPLAAIDDSTDDGRRLLATARRVLAERGKPDAAAIAAADTADAARVFSLTMYNGDGVAPPAAADEPARATMREIIACLGSQTDRSGQPGVTQELADQFFAECRAWAEWRRQAVGPFELTAGTDAAAALLVAVRAKVDDYFTRCRLAAFDARAAAALNRDADDYLAFAAKTLTPSAEDILGLPLARVEAGRPLPLGEGVNPAWSDTMAAFRAEVVAPLLGDRESLTRADWTALQEKFAGYFRWQSAKPATSVEKLGAARIDEILANGSEALIAAAIARDKSFEAEFDAIEAVDRLVRCRRDYVRLLNNFVSFRDFYSGVTKGIFQAGTLFLDQRSCELCLRVDDAAKHMAMAHRSSCCLVYCDCVRRGGAAAKMTIVAAMTAGDSDGLIVGRHGVFYDRGGGDWDATVVKIIENPISLRQAFWSPYKRAIRWAGEQIAKRAAAADSAAVDKLKGAAADGAPGPADGKPPAPAAPAKPHFDVGAVAAMGVAVGGITAAFGAILNSFFGLGMWMPLGMVGLLFLISGPSMVIAALKLRQRNLGPLLDANGWAMNAEARINIPFGRALTHVAKLPKGARRDLFDPFKEKHGRRHALMAVAALLLLAAAIWKFGGFNRHLPPALQSHPWHAPHVALPALPSAPLTLPPPAPPP